MVYPAFGKHRAEPGTCKSKNSRETAKKSLFLKRSSDFLLDWFQ